MTDFSLAPVYFPEGSTLTMGSVVSSSFVRKGCSKKKTPVNLKKNSPTTDLANKRTNLSLSSPHLVFTKVESIEINKAIELTGRQVSTVNKGKS